MKQKLAASLLSGVMIVSYGAVPALYASRGDGIAAGIAVGAMTGLTTAAIASNANRESKATREAREARREAEMLRREQEREKFDRLERQVDRREVDKKDQQIRQMAERMRQLEQQQGAFSGNTMMGIMIAIIIILMVAVFGLGVVVLRRR